MKRLQMLSVLILFVAVLLGGSAEQKQSNRQPVLTPVIQVDISCRSNNEILYRHYTHPEKIEPVLHYLRTLKYCGKAETDPERIAGNAYEITLQYATGEHHIYRQRADRFLSKDNQPWEKIDPEQAKHLYTLLQFMPDDCQEQHIDKHYLMRTEPRKTP